MDLPSLLFALIRTAVNLSPYNMANDGEGNPSWVGKGDAVGPHTLPPYRRIVQNLSVAKYHADGGGLYLQISKAGAKARSIASRSGSAPVTWACAAGWSADYRSD